MYLSLSVQDVPLMVATYAQLRSVFFLTSIVLSTVAGSCKITPSHLYVQIFSGRGLGAGLGSQCITFSREVLLLGPGPQRTLNIATIQLK